MNPGLARGDTGIVSSREGQAWSRFGYFRTKLLARFGRSGTPLMPVFNGAAFTNAPQGRLEGRPIIIHLDHPLFHVGDQIFYRPLAYRLKEAGLDVAVTNTSNVDFLFADMARDEPGPRPGAVVITRLEVAETARAIYGPSATYLVFYTASRSIRQPIANFLIEAVVEWFGLRDITVRVNETCFGTVRPDSEAVRRRFQIPSERPLIALSNYIDSGHHRKLPWRERELVRGAVSLKRSADGIIVHIGTAHDKARDQRDYSGIVDLDLRGSTTVEDLFGLLGSPNLRAAFCFDTAVLHISRIFGVETHLVPRYYLSRHERTQKALAFYNFFAEGQ